MVEGGEGMSRAIIMMLAFGAVMLVSIPFMYLVIPRIVNPEGTVPVEPVVLVSKSPENTTSPQWHRIHDEFAKVYTPADTNTEFLYRLMDIMANKAKALGEDPVVLRNCILACYPGGTPGTTDMIPCFAEKGRWNGQAVWIIAFNWGSSSERHLSHFNVCYVSIPDMTIVHTEICD